MTSPPTHAVSWSFDRERQHRGGSEPAAKLRELLQHCSASAFGLTRVGGIHTVVVHEEYNSDEGAP